MVEDERHAARIELSALLPDGWVAIGPVWRGTVGLWVVYARQMTGPQRDREVWREASGQTEALAIRALAQLFKIGRA